jgi:hypothetical protein
MPSPPPEGAAPLLFIDMLFIGMLLPPVDITDEEKPLHIEGSSVPERSKEEGRGGCRKQQERSQRETEELRTNKNLLRCNAKSRL